MSTNTELSAQEQSDLMLPLYRRCNQLRPRELFTQHSTTLGYFVSMLHIQNGTEVRIYDSTAAKLRNAQMTEYLDVLGHTGRKQLDGSMEIDVTVGVQPRSINPIIKTVHAPTKTQALALACTAVLDSREEK